MFKKATIVELIKLSLIAYIITRILHLRHEIHSNKSKIKSLLSAGVVTEHDHALIMQLNATVEQDLQLLEDLRPKRSDND